MFVKQLVNFDIFQFKEPIYFPKTENMRDR